MLQAHFVPQPPAANQAESRTGAPTGTGSYFTAVEIRMIGWTRRNAQTVRIPSVHLSALDARVPTPATGRPGARLTSLDALRGAVMILMALDHVRDFFHSAAAAFSPTDLAKTTPTLFLTRWITHFCLPVFMFTAGASAWLWWQRGGRSKAALSRFLWSRGLWFVFLELTVMQFAYDFNWPARFPILLLVLWVFGICMVAMAALVYLPRRWLLAGSLAIIALHDTLDGLQARQFGAAAPLWQLIHQPGFFIMAGKPILATYTLLPWIAVLAAGFCFAPILELDAPARRRALARIGFGLTAGFLLLRALNVYGDPARWTPQRSAVYTALSFLNCTKYPASLDFLLMTLGPALLALAWLDRRALAAGNPLVVFGRVPMFYFVLHFYLVHGMALVLAFVRYGSAAAAFVFQPPPSMGTARNLFPGNYGYSLPATYLVWIAVVALLYPVCRWFANLKRARRSWWLSYL